MFRAWRKSLVIVGCLVAVATVGSGRLWAEDAQPSGDAPQVAPADKPSDAGMVDCPFAPKGGCCGTCQEKGANPAGGAGKEAFDCPCKRARAAEKGS